MRTIILIFFLFLTVDSFSQLVMVTNNPPPTVLLTNLPSTVLSPIFTDVTNGLVSYWPLTNTFADVIGINSGTGQGGTGIPIPTNGPDGSVNGSTFFNSARTQYINCGTNSSQDLTNDYSCSYWMNPISIAGSFKSVISKGVTMLSGQFPAPYLERLATSGTKITGFRGDGVNSQGITSTASYTNNAWTFVCHTSNGATNRIYINGLLDTQTVFTSPNLPPYATTNRALVIGGSEPTVSLAVFYSGSLAGIRIYNRGISSNEVFQIYSLGINRKKF